MKFVRAVLAAAFAAACMTAVTPASGSSVMSAYAQHSGADCKSNAYRVQYNAGGKANTGDLGRLRLTKRMLPGTSYVTVTARPRRGAVLCVWVEAHKGSLESIRCRPYVGPDRRLRPWGKEMLLGFYGSQVRLRPGDYVRSNGFRLTWLRGGECQLRYRDPAQMRSMTLTGRKRL
ncbi:MAG TPA: hypothetical protein VF272_02875 [Candidatus Saccharimonadia bacterium]